MKVAEAPKSTTAKNTIQAKRQPFFNKDGEGSFFSKSTENTTPFFKHNTLPVKGKQVGIQPKLTIGKPNDKYEVEADAMADKVVQRLSESKSNSPLEGGKGDVFNYSGQGAVQTKCSTCEEKEKLQKKDDNEVSESNIEVQRKPIFESNAEQPEANVQTKPVAPFIQTKCASCEQEEKLQKKEEEVSEKSVQLKESEEEIQAKDINSPSGGQGALQSRLDYSKGGGNSLPSNVQTSMGSAFGADFSNVKVHTGSEAVQMNKDLNAQAFTYGSDIYFNQGKYNPNTSSGQHLLAHELTHTIQQGKTKSIQKATTRGAGGCGPPRAIDEDNTGAKGAGATAHRQIQSFLLPRALGELPIPRATKTRMDNRGCQRTGINLGYADLFTLGQSNVGIAEIKPYPWATQYAIPESEHYIRRGRQSMGRYSGVGSCSQRRAGDDDRDFAENRIGVSRNRPASFYKINNILQNDTTIGRFDGDPNRLLKARLVAPGAVGYWCTGEGTDTYTCGMSQRETEQYIDRVLLPGQDLLDEFLEEYIERPLEDLINNFSVGSAFSAGQSAAPGLYAQQIALINSMLPPGVSIQSLINALLAEIGPYARPIIITMLRRFKSMLINQLRIAIRNALRQMIREVLISLCVGVPVVTLVQLLNELKKKMKEMTEQMLPELATAVLATLAVQAMASILATLRQIITNALRSVLDVLGIIGDFLYEALMVVLRILAIVLIAIMVIGVIVLALLALAAALDPVPGDEVALGGLTVALAALIPVVWSFVLNGPEEGNPETI